MDYKSYIERKGIDTYGGAGDHDFKILCPFHDDTDPSLEVHEHTGVFYCFVCKTTGPFHKLIAQLDGTSEADAKKALMQDENVDGVLSDIHNIFDEYDAEDTEKSIKYFSSVSFHKNFQPLVMSTSGLSYVINRGIPRRFVKDFDLRWGGSEGKWRNRVIIPIRTEEGKLLTYAGRIINNSIKPKTMKVKGRTPQDTLYGLWELMQRTGLTRFEYLILVEGEFDAMYLQSFGLPAVSTMGTSKLTGKQLFALKKRASCIVYSYDGDEAGAKAQGKGVLRVRGYMPTIRVSLPAGKDPNELSNALVKTIYRRFFL